MTTIDLKKTERRLYDAAPEPELADIPAMRYLMIDGAGNPNSGQEYVAAIETLYPTAYAVRRLLKDESGVAYVVAPLEGLWWADDMQSFTQNEKDAWLWTMMIRVPDEASPDLVDQAIATTIEKKRPPAGDRIRHEILEEGRVAQVMHKGPYAEEGPVIERLHAFIAAHGHEPSGKHHEIYLSDPRKSAPEKMRTIIRQPVR